MSLLNLTSDGLPSVLLYAFRYAFSCGQPLPREDFEAACMPVMSPAFTLKDDAGKQLRQTLNTWIALGLFSEDGHGGEATIALSPRTREALGGLKDLDEATRLLPEVARTIVFLQANRERLWESKENKASDLARALGWLCLQDVWTLAVSNSAEALSIEQEQFGLEGDTEIFRNMTRWAGFTSWATYLGFGFTSPDGYRVDPTPAVRDVVRASSTPTGAIPVAAFSERIGSVLPVLDGGDVRKAVAARMREATWTRPNENEFSPALSMALLRLEREGTLELESRADAPKRTLLGRHARSFGRAVSHIRVKESGHATA